MLGISGIAFLGFLAFRLIGTSNDVPIAEHRSFEEISLSWKCEAGHTFRALGNIEGGTCPKCGAIAYPTEPFECKQHGTFAVSAKFELSDSGKPKVSQYRVLPREWVAAEVGPKCPKCLEPLDRRPRDPLAGVERPKRREVRPPREAVESDDGQSTP